MLGEKVLDSFAVESDEKVVKGLGVLPIITEMQLEKKTVQATGFTDLFGSSAKLTGYEVHMGLSKSTQAVSHFAVLNGEKEGCNVDNGKIVGTYLHHVFHNDKFRGDYLNHIREEKGLESLTRTMNINECKQNEFNRLAQYVKQNVDIERIKKMMKK